MRKPGPLHPLARKTPILYRERADWGITRGRLRSSDIAHPFHGVHLASGAPDGVRERAEAFIPLLRDSDAFSHTTAAAILGAQLPRGLERDPRIHVTTLRGADRFRRRGVVGHRAAELPLVVHGGLPLVHPAHAWVQLASMLQTRDLVAVGDRWVTPRAHGLDVRPALLAREDLQAAVDASRGGRGAARAREALRLVRVGPESRMETLLRLMLIRAGLPEPLIAPRLTIDDQEYHPDLMYPDEGVVIEYQGDGHRTDARQWRADLTRREVFQSAGLHVVEAHAGDVLAEPEAFLARLCRVLADRRARSRPH